MPLTSHELARQLLALPDREAWFSMKEELKLVPINHVRELKADVVIGLIRPIVVVSTHDAE